MEACPCCGYATLSERGAFEICPICAWEDDGQDNVDADAVRGGPNDTSLTAARRTFLEVGASTTTPGFRAPGAGDRRLRHFELRGASVVEVLGVN